MGIINLCFVMGFQNNCYCYFFLRLKVAGNCFCLLKPRVAFLWRGRGLWVLPTGQEQGAAGIPGSPALLALGSGIATGTASPPGPVPMEQLVPCRGHCHVTHVPFVVIGCL